MAWIVGVILAALAALAASPAEAQTRTTLQQVTQRGQLVCGANGELPGFSFHQNNVWSGMDVDLCRGIAAAIFDDPNRVRFVPLTAADRFDALMGGQIDVLARNSTWTLERDTTFALDFPAINFFDGQGLMVRRSMNVTSALQLGGASICILEGTTTELNIVDFFRTNNLQYEAVLFDTPEETIRAYDAGRCDVFSADASALYAQRIRLQRPDDHLVLPEIISKEPLGPVVRQADARWSAIVRWVHFAMVTAEEHGLTQANVVEAARTDQRPEVRRLLGREGEFGQMLGLPSDWAVRIVRHVGNYGEVFQRNVGERSALGIRRGLNALWTRGGLQYAPPIR